MKALETLTLAAAARLRAAALKWDATHPEYAHELRAAAREIEAAEAARQAAEAWLAEVEQAQRP